jgi:hypothetical protein
MPEPMLWQVFSPTVIARAKKLGGPCAEALILSQIQIALMPYFLNSSANMGEDTST